MKKAKKYQLLNLGLRISLCGRKLNHANCMMQLQQIPAHGPVAVPKRKTTQQLATPTYRKR